MHTHHTKPQSGSGKTGAKQIISTNTPTGSKEQGFTEREILDMLPEVARKVVKSTLNRRENAEYRPHEDCITDRLIEVLTRKVPKLAQKATSEVFLINRAKWDLRDIMKSMKRPGSHLPFKLQRSISSKKDQPSKRKDDPTSANQSYRVESLDALGEIGTEAPDSSADPSEMLAYKETRERYEEALRLLPEDRQRYFRHRYEEEESVNECYKYLKGVGRTNAQKVETEILKFLKNRLQDLW